MCVSDCLTYNEPQQCSARFVVKKYDCLFFILACIYSCNTFSVIIFYLPQRMATSRRRRQRSRLDRRCRQRQAHRGFTTRLSHHHRLFSTQMPMSTMPTRGRCRRRSSNVIESCSRRSCGTSNLSARCDFAHAICERVVGRSRRRK